MTYDLPKTAEVCGVTYNIRSDFRAILDIFEILNDPDLSNEEKLYTALLFFYEDFEALPPTDYREAWEQCVLFINCGETEQRAPQRPLVSWKQDFRYIVAPINRVAQTEIRALPYLHWWTFIGYYMEIGDCLFAQIVNIRNKLARGKSLDKSEREFYRKNKAIIDLKTEYSEAEQALLKEWT